MGLNWLVTVKVRAIFYAFQIKEILAAVSLLQIEEALAGIETFKTIEIYACLHCFLT